MKRIYMDYAATTPLDPRVRKAIDPYFDKAFGNPSSIHSFGQETLTAVETARKQVAGLLHAEPSEIVFNSGGTESDNTAIKGVGYALKDKGTHIITSAIEHHAVLRCCEFMASQGFDVTFLPVGREGIVDPSDVKKAIHKDTILISIMHANNEIGTLQPISEIGAIAKEKSILFHTDAVQTFGHIEIDVNRIHVDLLSLSAHKVYGPKGVGALYIKKGTPLIPLLHGGGQEEGRRSSTHNVAGIVGLGKAAEIARMEMAEEGENITFLRDKLLKQIEQQIDDVDLNGHRTQRLPNNINISIKHVEGEAILMSLDLEGIAASSGSACSSGSTEPSHVLMALGLSPELARGSLRLTLGKYTDEKEVETVADTLQKMVSHLRSLSPFGKGA
ncbi:cysteine desulfurase NifS [bacterium]|nr:cysteine desulfurase NifS [bacterium]